MSWDACLIDERDGTVLIDTNYTHNTSGMIYAVLEDSAYDIGTGPWWAHLNGLTGPQGAAYLNLIVRGLESEPDRYSAMNPSNGWGNYESLTRLLTEMRNAVPERPCRWEACG